MDIGRLVTGMSDLLRRTLGEQITVETVLAGGLWCAHADPNQLELAILNLAVNARDAMPAAANSRSKRPMYISMINMHPLRPRSCPGSTSCWQSPITACGMTAEVKAKAFDPFFTTKDIGHGTGLGLSQVYGFVKQSRGHIKIYSELGEGTSVKIYLPRYYAEKEKQDAEPVQIVARGTQHETILVVEDDEDVRSYTIDTLRELGYQVLDAPNGHTALQLLEHHPEIDVLFTDIGLPGKMNGRRLAEEARKRRTTMRVLFTTAYARNAIVHDGRLDPGVELLPKPFTQAALAEKLRDILDAKSGPARILLVEQERVIQLLVMEYLQDAGLKVDVAGSVTDALNKLRLIPGSVDAVIVDVAVPDRNGDALIREMRSLYPSLPLLLASGRGQEDLQLLFKDVPLTSVVRKPYTAEGLMAALRGFGIPIVGGRQLSERL